MMRGLLMSDLMRNRGLLVCHNWMNLLVNWRTRRRSVMTLVVMVGAMFVNFSSRFAGWLESFARIRLLFWVMRRSRLLQLLKQDGIFLVVVR